MSYHVDRQTTVPSGDLSPTKNPQGSCAVDEAGARVQWQFAQLIRGKVGAATAREALTQLQSAIGSAAGMGDRKAELTRPLDRAQSALEQGDVSGSLGELELWRAAWDAWLDSRPASYYRPLQNQTPDSSHIH